MTADTHPVPTHGCLAPDPVLLSRAIHEQPPAAGIATAAEAVALTGKRQRGGQEVIGDTIPAVLRRAYRSVGTKPVADAVERDIHRTPPVVRVEVGIVGERTDRIPEGAEALELGLRRRAPGIRDGVGREELDGPLGCVEMVMRGFAVSGTSAVMRAGPVEAVRQPEGGVGPELPCNGVHRR